MTRLVFPAKVALEGISPDLTHANGAYGVQAEYGLDSPEALVSFFRRVEPLDLPASRGGCPPAVTLEAEGKVFRFQLGGGRLFSEETETDVTPEQILDLVMAPAMAGEVRKHVRGIGATNPRAVRFPHLPPTKKNLFEYDTGPHQPQIAFTLYRTPSDKWGPLFVASFIPVLGFLALGGLTQGEPLIGLFMALPTLGLVVWVWRWMGSRHRTFRMGFDWGENVLWSEWGRSATAAPGLEKHVGYVPDANTVLTVDLVEEWEWSGSTGDGESRHRCWQLVARNVDGATTPVGPKIYTRKEARGVLQGAAALLAAQR